MTMLFTNAAVKIRRVIKIGPNVIQTATIMGRHTRGGPASLPKPFPYEDKPYRWYDAFWSNTMYNVSQENAKIVVVEGPIGVGKSAFCSVLAEQFDMHYIPQPTLDKIFVLPSGYDIRQHNDEVPEDLRTYDHKNFCIDPKNKKAADLQYNTIILKFYQYIDALCHLLNTGQGVVLERSYFSDYVFLNAMHQQQFVSRDFVKAYYTIIKNTETFLIPPHLVIYLDIPVPVVQERIRTRNYSWEQNSPALTKEYLTSLENNWKHDYLKKASKYSDILIYDWSEGGEVEVVIDDIEKINFDSLRPDCKFKNWWLNRHNLSDLRKKVTNQTSFYQYFFYYPWYKLDDYTPSHFYSVWKDILSKNPECAFARGYNYKMNDSIWKILFSSKPVKHRDPKYYFTD